MTINGPVYSRGATSGINTVKSYNSFGSRNSQTIAAESMSRIYDYENPTEFSVISSTGGNSTLVSGVPNYSIEVESYVLVSSGSSSIKFLSDSTDITGTMQVAANGSISANSKDGLIKTGSGEALVLNSTSAVAGHISYRLV